MLATNTTSHCGCQQCRFNNSVIIMDTSLNVGTVAEGFNLSLSENELIDYLTSNVSGNASFDNGTAPVEFHHLPAYNYLMVSVLNILVFAVGVVGNMLVICVVSRVRAMRNPTNYFLFTLSIADLLVLLICQPVALSEFYTKQRWYIGEFMCKLVPLLENGSLHVSILIIIAMTTERYYAIIYPFKKMSNVTNGLTVKVIVGLWLFAYACTSPFIALTHLERTAFYDGSTVWVCRTTIYLFWHKAYIVVNTVAFFALPFVMLFFMYARIIQKMVSDSLTTECRQDPRLKLRRAHRRQVVKMLILIIILFFVSMFPLRVVTLWHIFAPLEQIHSIGIVAYYNIIWFARIMMYINSAGNPIIYCISSTKFKLAFKSILRRHTICVSRQPTRSSSNSARFHVRRTRRGLNASPVDRNAMGRDREAAPARKHNTVVIRVNFVERTP